MANWMICQYYEASVDRFKPNNGLPINDKPVNLDLVETFYKEGDTKLVFVFQKNPSIVWEFVNIPLRNKEYERALHMITEKEELLIQ